MIEGEEVGIFEYSQEFISKSGVHILALSILKMVLLLFPEYFPHFEWECLRCGGGCLTGFCRADEVIWADECLLRRRQDKTKVAVLARFTRTIN